MTDKVYDVIIIGGGPAGLAAAINAGRANLETLLIERGVFGGNITLTSEIANYPGCIPNESGNEFAERMTAQADSFGVTRINAEVTEVKFLGYTRQITCGNDVYKCKIVIIATGNTLAKLGVPGEEKFTGLGVSYCAICDGPFFRGREVFVVGGGDTAVEEAIYLAKFAKKVTIIHRRDEFRAAKSIVENAEKTENIEFMFSSVVKELDGEDMLTRIVVENVITNDTVTIEAEEGLNLGCFIFVGLIPNTNLFEGIIEMEDGYIITDEEMRTSMPGIFATGDVRKKSLRQVVTATADGAVAAFEAEKIVYELDKREEID